MGVVFNEAHSVRMTIRMMLFALFAVAFQFGLAILGWGSFRAFFANPARVFRSEVGVLIAVLVVLPLLDPMDAEEKTIREHFGSEYQAYYARTNRLISGVY